MKTPEQWTVDFVTLPPGTVELLIRLKFAQRRHAYGVFVGALPDTASDANAQAISHLECKLCAHIDEDLFAALVEFTQDQADIEFEIALTYSEREWCDQDILSYSEQSLQALSADMETVEEHAIHNWAYWADQPGQCINQKLTMS